MPATPPGKFTAPLAVADSHRNSRSGNDLVPRIALLMAGLSFSSEAWQQSLWTSQVLGFAVAMCIDAKKKSVLGEMLGEAVGPALCVQLIRLTHHMCE
jgi:hypothetical protein